MIKKLFILLVVLFPLRVQAQTVEKLSNGMTLIVNDDPSLPLVTLQVRVRAGSIYETDYPGSGISHFIEHLLFTDTRKRTGVALARVMKELGCDMNGYTTFEDTVYHFTLASPHLKDIIPLVKEMVFEPAFKEDQIEKERSVILKEINMNTDDPDRFFSNLIFSSSYSFSFYRYPVIGIRELFLKVKRKDLLAYYQRFYVPDNMAVVVSGDCGEEALKLIREQFGALERRFFVPADPADEPEQTGAREVLKYRSDMRLERLALVWKTVDIRHGDLFGLDVLAMLLGSGKNSVLNRILKEKKKLVSSVSAFSYTPLKKGVFIIEAELNPGVDLREVKEEIIRIIRGAPSLLNEKELGRIKATALRNYYKGRETVNSMASDLGLNWSSTGDIHFSGYYTDGLRAVTVKDVGRAVSRYFSADRMTLVALLPESGKTKQEERPTRSPGRARDLLEKSGPFRMILHQDKKLPFVSISVLFRAGPLFEPEERPGISHFLAKMLVSRTDDLSKEKLLGLIEDKGGTISTFSGNNSIGMTIEVFRENIPDALRVLGEILLRTDYDGKDMETYRKEILQEISRNREQIFSLGREFLFREMYGSYGYALPKTGSEKSVRAMSPEHLSEFAHRILRPSNAVVSVSGDMEPEIMARKIKEALGKWKGDETDLKEPGFDLREISFTQAVQEADKEQSLLFLSFFGPSVRDEERLEAELAWYILNGQGSRIFVNLREKRELAYFAGLFPFYGLTTGLLVFYAGTVKDKIEAARQGLLQEIGGLVKNGITQEELDGAKKELLSDKLKLYQTAAGAGTEYGFELLYNGRIRTIDDTRDLLVKIDRNGMNGFIRRIFEQPYKVVILKGK